MSCGEGEIDRDMGGGIKVEQIPNVYIYGST